MVVELAAILPEARALAMRKAGLWTDQTLINAFDKRVSESPSSLAVIDYNSVTEQRGAMTYAQLRHASLALASGLRRLGIRKGDVVAVQLPNWWQFIAIHLACLRLGAITNPLVMIFRERELTFMLSLSEAKVIFTTAHFRKFDHGALALDVMKAVPSLKHVALVEESGYRVDGGELCRWTDHVTFEAQCPLSADDVVQILYTSGTTGEPKGVMHTSNTLLSTLKGYASRLSMSQSDVILMGSPLTHQTGFMYGMMLPLLIGCPTVLMDIWDGEKAAEICRQDGVTYSMGSTPFLSDLTLAAERDPTAFRAFRVFHAAGATIPRALVRDAKLKLGADVLSGWGMTENGAVTTTLPGDPPEKVFETDGCPLPGMEIRIVGEDGKVLPSGHEGSLQVRGCANFVGYLKRPNLYQTDKSGWFDTGDLGRVDDDGYVRITGRTKDILIRGGENIPVVEIEGLLFQHPAIREVAVVGVPHPRLGEQACAFVVLEDDQQLNLQMMIEFLREKKISKNYFPEHLVVASELPKTPSGKIQKFVLREHTKKLA